MQRALVKSPVDGILRNSVGSFRRRVLIVEVGGKLNWPWRKCSGQVRRSWVSKMWASCGGVSIQMKASSCHAKFMPSTDLVYKSHMS